LSPSAAIVTTLRNADAVLDDFVAHHIAIGFDHLFLFFDDPADPGLERAHGWDRVTAFARDDTLEARWRNGRFHRALQDQISKEVMARLILNCDLAIAEAARMGIDWLLHIDADELFHTPGKTAPEHFAELAARGIDNVVYFNFESLPETESIDNFFRDVTLFKKNPSCHLGTRFDAVQKDLIASVPQFRERLFLVYDNGKSAARVGPALVPMGVHLFGILPDRERRPHFASDDAVILHYNCCGFEQFWTKYRTLGPITDRWFGRHDIRDLIGSFHLDARDVVMSGDRAAARRFYRERIMMTDPTITHRLLDAGVLARIDEPSRRLRAP
jgi:hypothetical protein